MSDVVEVLIWHDKHGDFTYGGDDAALKMLRDRIKGGYLTYPDDAEEKAQRILDSGNENAAYRFLLGRDEFEYERISRQRLR